VLAAISHSRVIILVACVGVAFVLGRLVNYRRTRGGTGDGTRDGTRGGTRDKDE
jgi:hypothetical protein